MTHIFPWNEKAEASYSEEARSEFKGEAIVATDMMEIRV
jgi:ribonuclease BN (tRNA processing enzyme)